MWPFVLVGGGVLLTALVLSSGGPRRIKDAGPPFGGSRKPPFRYSSPYGYRVHPVLHRQRLHEGLDLPVPEGTPIFAPVDGTVVVSRAWDGEDAGGTAVAIDGEGYRWWFLHLLSASVPKGIKVKKGQLLGFSGNTGAWTTGPHLHFQIEDLAAKKAGLKPSTVDPLLVMPAGMFVPFPTSPKAGIIVGSFEPVVGPILAGEAGDDEDPEVEPDSDPFVSQTDPEAEAARLDAETAEIVETYRLPEEDARAIVEAADWVGGSGLHLARVMWAESRMNPKAVNRASGATGLIQWLPSSAAKLGTTIAAIKAMSFRKQVALAERYLEAVALGEWAGGDPGPLDTQFKMAAAVFYPAWRNRNPASVLPRNVREANPTIATMGEYLSFVLGRKPPAKPAAPQAGAAWSVAGDAVDAVIDEIKERFWKTGNNIVHIERWLGGRAVRVLTTGGNRPTGLPGSLDGIPIIVQRPPPGWQAPDEARHAEAPAATRAAGFRRR